METLIELKALAYDAAVQTRIWQDRLDRLNQQINSYVQPQMQEEQKNGKDTTIIEGDRKHSEK